MSLRYIAASLGLSVTTVSRALAGYSDVAEDTRRRVKAEAERIGYVPNAIARRLQKGRTDAIGVVAPTGRDAVSDSYLYTAFSSAWTRLSELDRDLVMLPSLEEADEHANEYRTFRRAVEERRVDGLLLLRTRRDDWRIPYLRAANIPFVVFGTDHAGMTGVTAIGVDNDDAADKVLTRLTGFGHRRIALVVPEGDYDFVSSRHAAFERGRERHDIELRTATATFCEDGGRAATARLLAVVDHPTAIVYFANRMALGGLQAFSDSILVPGRHVSVVSFGDNPTLRYATPPITAVRAPVEEMIRHAIDVLIGQSEGRVVEPNRRWKMTLIERQSDGPLVSRPNGHARFAASSSVPSRKRT